MERKPLLLINPLQDIAKLKALASEQRVAILAALKKRSFNINELAAHLSLPQSNIATHTSILEKAGLITAEKTNAKKGSQKICSVSFSEILIEFPEEPDAKQDTIDVEMPIGIFTNYSVTPPCGLCTSENVIGFLDTPDSFLEPDRMKAGLLWLGSGFVEYKFPNNAKYETRPLKKIEVAAELSSETPGTNKNWPSDITLWINGVEIGDWTSPGDFGDRRGKFTPEWWKLEGSQYGLLKRWSVTGEGSFVDGVQVSGVTLDDIAIMKRSSICVKFGVKETARRMGGMNIFGHGFGNYSQGILLRLHFAN